MKAFLNSFVMSLCLWSAAAGHAQQDGKDAKEIPVQQEPKPVSQDEWRFSITPYFWLPTVDADLSVPDVTVGNCTIGGNISVNVPWWETLSKFSSDFYVLGLMGRAEAWKGRWGGFVDGYWAFGKSTVGSSDSRLVLRDRIDITATSSVTSRFDSGQVSFGPQFVLGTAPLGSTSSVSFIAYGGGRINWANDDVDGSLTIRASANIGEIGQTFNFSSNRGRAFIEPMIGLKTSWALGKNFEAILRGDVGGFGVVTADNWDCDLEAGDRLEFRRNTYLDSWLSRPRTVAGSWFPKQCKCTWLVSWAGAWHDLYLLGREKRDPHERDQNDKPTADVSVISSDQLTNEWTQP